MKKTVALAGVFACVCGITAAGVMAAPRAGGQTDKPKEAATQKAGAKPHTMTGCLEKGADETTFRLTKVEGTGPQSAELHADAKLKLAGHVGHKVAITGTDIDPKTLKKETSATTGGGATAGGATATTGSKEPASGHHMRVQSMKHIAPTCS